MGFMQISRTDQFKKAWDKLTEVDKSHGRKAIQLMVSNLRTPGLQVKKIKSAGDIWEARASHSLRITLQISKETIVLRNIGQHDKTLDNP
jgi:mRNA-degrading endonuclease RelE of RelBE toxin-antitoxin system